MKLKRHLAGILVKLMFIVKRTGVVHIVPPHVSFDERIFLLDSLFHVRKEKLRAYLSHVSSLIF